MDGLQWTSHLNSVNAIRKRSLIYLALMLALYPTLSQQELTAHSRRFPSSSKVTGKTQKSSTTLQHGPSSPGSSPHMAAMTNGNATLEDISERLVRVDNSLASLIQTVLAVQRTVFNLEQLQELLVLLLEDILKQTGSVDKIPRTDTTPTFNGGTSGGTSQITDSDDNDSADIASTDGDDGIEDDRVTANPGDLASVDKVNGRSNEPAVRNSLVLGPFGTRNEQFGMSALSQNNNEFPAGQSTDPSKLGGREDSAGDSSEGGRSNSNEDYSGGFMRVMQRSTQPANIPVPNSRRSQWSEPIMAHGIGNSQSRLFDVVHRMVSQLDQSAARPAPRLLGLMQGGSVSHLKESESIFEHPPIYQPLEIVPAHDSALVNEKRPLPRMFPLKIKLLPESVISHGGPQTGPEHFSSIYLEHPEGHSGVETAGETSTGMINNLVQHSPSHITGNDSHVHDSSQVDYFGQTNIHTPVTDIRRKREAFKNFLRKNNTNADAGNQEFHTSFNGNESQQGNNNFIVSEETSSRNVKRSTSSNKFTTNKNNAELQLVVPKDNVVNVNSSQGLFQDKDEKKSGLGGAEYDNLIGRLLSDLSTQLHSLHQERDASSDDALSQALYGLDKLIWVSHDIVSHSPVTFDVTNTSAATEEETESSDNVSGMAPSGEMLHEFSVETKSLSQQSSGKYEHRNASYNKTIRKAKEVAHSRKDNANSNTYAVLPPQSAVYRDVVVSEQERIKHLNRPEILENANTTSDSDSENVTSSTYEVWDWLYLLLGNFERQTADMKLLVDKLNNLSRNASFADELRELNTRGQSILGRTVYIGELENNINRNTENDAVNNVTTNDDDDVSDDSTMTVVQENSSSDDKDDKVIGEEETDIVNHDTFEAFEKDDSPEIVNRKDNVNFNRDQNVFDGQEEGSSSKEHREKDGDSHDANSSQVDEIEQIIPEDRHAQTNPDVWPLKTASFLDSPSQIKSQSSFLSARQIGSAHPDFNINNIENEFIYRKPRTTENKLYNTGVAIDTQTQRKEIPHVIRRQKRRVDHPQNKNSYSIPNSRHIENQQKTVSQAQLSPGNTGATNSNTGSIVPLVQGTNNTEIRSQNASQSSSNVDIKKNSIIQQNIVQSALNSSQNPDTNHINAQSYGQRDSNLHSFDSPPNGYSQTHNLPDYESFGGTSSPEDMETPSIEEHSALDLEEVLTSLFLSYWQRFYHLYTRAPPLMTTSADLETEEEAAEATLSTSASPVVTNTGHNNSDLSPTASMKTSGDKEVSNTTSKDVAGG